MGESRSEQCELTCMVMVCDEAGNLLVQDRKGNWAGLTFPGGHVEPGESFTGCAVREVKEETGLEIWNLRLCGVKQFQKENGVRYLVFYFKTKDFSGELKASEEGAVFWMKKEELLCGRMAEGFDKMLEVFEREELNENFYVKGEKGEWELRSV